MKFLQICKKKQPNANWMKDLMRQFIEEENKMTVNT